MTREQAIKKLSELPTDDPEVAHSLADVIVLKLLNSEANIDVVLAYEDVVASSDWWAYA